MRHIDTFIVILWSAALLYLTYSGAVAISYAYAEAPESHDLAELSVEELINLEVTSVSKKRERLSQSAAAVYVITSEDIRRSGATSIPEALRLAPGVNVARISANSWAISVRGFNSFFSNKLLVLVDGRSVYTPLFSGVNWDAQDLMLEDIERIEVIRGPGATLWGSNAVNGVINIISKSSAQSQNGVAALGGGSDERGAASVRYGGELDDSASYRMYVKYLDEGDSEHLGTAPSHDKWHSLRSGFRTDWALTENDALTVQGDVALGDARRGYSLPSVSAPFTESVDSERDIQSANVLARWTKAFSDGSEMQTQVYYDRIKRREILLDEERNTGDFDLQHRIPLSDSNELLWGVGYNIYGDDLDGGDTLSFEPVHRTVDLLTWFVQDEISLLDDRLKFILGSKFEETEFTGFEYQPGARLLYIPAKDHSLWAAVSRALRTPSRGADDSSLALSARPSGSLTQLDVLKGNDGYDSESLLAYELGYRFPISKKASFDIALFYNDYDELQTLKSGEPFAAGTAGAEYLVRPLFIDNKGKGSAYGGEAVIVYDPRSWWRMILSYAYLDINTTQDTSSSGVFLEARKGESPQNQVNLRSLMDLGDVELDLAFRFVDALRSLDIDSYSELDLRVGWHVRKDLELSVLAHNLLDDEHLEFISQDFVSMVPTEAGRGVYGKVTWRF